MRGREERIWKAITDTAGDFRGYVHPLSRYNFLYVGVSS